MKSQSNTRLNNLEKYLLDDPKDPFLRYAIAMEYVKLAALLEAKMKFSDLLRDVPDYLAAYYQFGQLLEQLSDRIQAIEIYKTGIKIAEKQNNIRTLKELKQALEFLIEDEDEMI